MNLGPTSFKNNKYLDVCRGIIEDWEGFQDMNGWGDWAEIWVKSGCLEGRSDRESLIGTPRLTTVFLKLCGLKSAFFKCLMKYYANRCGAAPMYPHQPGYLKLARRHQSNAPRQRQWIIIKEKTGFKKTSENCRMIGYCIFCRTERMAAEKMGDIGSKKWFPSQSLCPSHPPLITKML